MDVSCRVCGFPIKIEESSVGTVVKCPYCGAMGTVKEVNMYGLRGRVSQGKGIGVNIPTPVFVGFWTFILGAVCSQALREIFETGGGKLAQATKRGLERF